MNYSKLFFFFLLISFFYKTPSSYSQSKNSITGQLLNSLTKEPVTLANIIIIDTTTIKKTNWGTSDKSGFFVIKNINTNTYKIQISAIGFKPYSKTIDIKQGNKNLGIISLKQDNILLNEIEIHQKRITAKTELNKTTYFINKHMQKATMQCIDILQLIPSIYIDLNNNIMLNGSKIITILVNGIERDQSFLSQLNVKNIDRIEISQLPSSKYNTSTSGTINIIYKPSKQTGINGHVYLELPISKSEIFLTPSYNLNYNSKKFNITSSYNSNLDYFDITNYYHRMVYKTKDTISITSKNLFRQKSWSHRFHLSLDYYFNKKNHFNIYTYYNPFSYELDGKSTLKIFESDTLNYNSLRDDNNINHSIFFSAWYKHFFNDMPDHSISFEFQKKLLIRKNRTTYTNNSSDIINNKINPVSFILNLKTDYSYSCNKKIKINAGTSFFSKKIKFSTSPNITYNNRNISVYWILYYTISQTEFNFGSRIEAQKILNTLSHGKSYIYLLPYCSLKYNISPFQNIKLSYRQHLTYPNISHLNPSIIHQDFFSYYSGNPNLIPETHNTLNLEYFKKLKAHSLSIKIFFDLNNNSIKNFMVNKGDITFSTKKYNLGKTKKAGIQITNHFALKNGGINSQLEIFNTKSIPKSIFHLSRQNILTLRYQLSLYLLISKNYTTTFNIHYSGPQNTIQGISSESLLYFLSIEKYFSKKLKLGITSGLPFAKNFRYDGLKIHNHNFSYFYKGDISLSSIPLWFKINYNFSSGIKGKKTKRTIPLSEKNNPSIFHRRE